MTMSGMSRDVVITWDKDKMTMTVRHHCGARQK
jgi:hypothetical protein